MAINIKLLFSIFLFNVTLNSLHSQSTTKLKVVLDAGHGGEDPGAVNRRLGLKEKDIALEICLRTEKLLSKNDDIEVFLTRKSDFFIPVYQRAEIANKQKANLFLSVHLNSTDNVSPFGTETFVMGLSKTQSNLEVAKKENSVITLEKDYKTKYEGYDPNSPESLIGLTILQEKYLDQSVRLASRIQRQYTENLKRYNRGVKQDVFLVLHKVAMPSVLTEIGFLSNDDEAKYMNSDEGKDKLAQSIANAIIDYKKEYFKEKSIIDSPNDYNEILKKEVIKEVVKEDKNGFDKKEQIKEDKNEISKKLDKIVIDEKQVLVDSMDKDKKSTKNNEKSVNDNEIVFKVQIRSSDKIIKPDDPFFKGFQITNFKENNLFKYYFFEANSIVEAKKHLIKAKKSGFKDAFIVGFKNEQRIDINQYK
jgi:N-acetylmuramoyl-L-alanine amidase